MKSLASEERTQMMNAIWSYNVDLLREKEVFEEQDPDKHRDQSHHDDFRSQPGVGTAAIRIQ